MRLIPSLTILVASTLLTCSAGYAERQSHETESALVFFKTEAACKETLRNYKTLNWIEGKTLIGESAITEVFPERVFEEYWKCEFVPSQRKWVFMPESYTVQEFKVAKGTKMYGGAKLSTSALWMSSFLWIKYSFCPETMQVVKSESSERFGSVLEFEKPPAKQSTYFVPKLFATSKQTEIHKRFTKLNDPCSPLSEPLVVSESKGLYPSSTHAGFVQKDPSDPTDNEFLNWMTVEQLKGFRRGGK